MSLRCWGFLNPPSFKILNMRQQRPLIGIPADRRLLGSHWFHCVGEKYIAAIIDVAGALPMLIPSMGGQLAADELLAHCDGVLLTGSPSNVEPHHYAGVPSEPGTWHDPARDATTLPFIPRLIEAGLPLLAICRGFQELNVALGGSLHQKLHEVPGFGSHREDDSKTLDEQYGPAHEVALTPGGLFEKIAQQSVLRVNSLHSQGIDRLAEGLSVEARSPDGVIEAVRVTNARRFAVGVQWHPEWRATQNEFSKSLFSAFGDAVRAYASGKTVTKVTGAV